MSAKKWIVQGYDLEYCEEGTDSYNYYDSGEFWERDRWIRYEDYQAETDRLRSENSEYRAARIAYASEFPLDINGEPDVGNIHANIRSLKSHLPNPDDLRRAIQACGVMETMAFSRGESVAGASWQDLGRRLRATLPKNGENA